MNTDMSTDATIGGSSSKEALFGKRKKKKAIQETQNSK